MSRLKLAVPATVKCGEESSATIAPRFALVVKVSRVKGGGKPGECCETVGAGVSSSSQSVLRK